MSQHNPARPATTSEIMLEALGNLQLEAERHRRAVEELQKLTHRPPAQASRKTLTATSPLWEVGLGTVGVESIGLLNFSAVTVYLGIAGRSAAQGNGIAVAPMSYIVLPLRTNVLDVGIDGSTAPDAGADVVVLKYDHFQEFEAGPLSSTQGTTGSPLVVGSSSTPTALPGASGNVLAAGAGWLCGFTARETSGNTAAVFRLRDATGGTILATVSLAGGESLRDRLPDVAFSTRLYFELVSGAVEGTAFTR